MARAKGDRYGETKAGTARSRHQPANSSIGGNRDSKHWSVREIIVERNLQERASELRAEHVAGTGTSTAAGRPDHSNRRPQSCCLEKALERHWEVRAERIYPFSRKLVAGIVAECSVRAPYRCKRYLDSRTALWSRERYAE
jgi:hypothetical protein